MCSELFLSDTKIFERFLVANYTQRLKGINKQLVDDHIRNLTELPVLEKIAKLEDKCMERKVSFKYDPSVAGPNKEREKEISKAIAGFCNTDGGILFIGVDTDGSAVGLKKIALI